MSVHISIVTTDNEVLPVDEAVYFDIGTAAGDINGGDFWSFVRDEFEEIEVKEIRIIIDKPVKISPRT